MIIIGKIYRKQKIQSIYFEIMNHQLEIKIFAIEFSKVDKDGQSKYNHPKCIICRSCYIFFCV
jgi:hypothetical protein